MPLINVQFMENVFTTKQKQELITRITDAVVSVEGESLRSVTWVKIDEVKEGNWGIGGQILHARDIHRMLKSGS